MALASPCHILALAAALSGVALTSAQTTTTTPSGMLCLEEPATSFCHSVRTAWGSHSPTTSPTTPPPSLDPTPSPTPAPTPPPTRPPTLGPTPAPVPQSWTGALVTAGCVYEGYEYAIDVYWSCGSEQWGQPLRLHTYKRHAYPDRAIFADQLITMRSGGQLWFDSYSTPRCVAVDSAGELQLRTWGGACTSFVLSSAATAGQYELKSGGRCVVITANCWDRGWTGGRECGGVLHMYLPIQLQACSATTTTTFRISTQADYCAGEFPGSGCF